MQTVPHNSDTLFFVQVLGNNLKWKTLNSMYMCGPALYDLNFEPDWDRVHWAFSRLSQLNSKS